MLDTTNVFFKKKIKFSKIERKKLKNQKNIFFKKKIQKKKNPKKKFAIFENFIFFLKKKSCYKLRPPGRTPAVVVLAVSSRPLPSDVFMSSRIIPQESVNIVWARATAFSRAAGFGGGAEGFGLAAGGVKSAASMWEDCYPQSLDWFGWS